MVHHEDLSLTPRTHVKSQVWLCTPANPVLRGGWRQDNRWGSLVSQTDRKMAIPGSVRDCLKETTQKRARGHGWPALTSASVSVGWVHTTAPTHKPHIHILKSFNVNFYSLSFVLQLWR